MRWNNQKPHPDARAVAYDMAFLQAGQSYCARVRARSDRDSAMGDIYGDYTCVGVLRGPRSPGAARRPPTPALLPATRPRATT